LKKILFISDNDGASWGGSENLWSETAKVLAKTYTVSALVKQWDKRPQAWNALLEAGVHLYFRTSKPKNSLIKRIRNKLFNYKDVIKGNPFTKVPELTRYDLAVISVCDSMNRSLPSYTKVLQAKGVPYVLLVQLATDLRMVPDGMLEALLKSYEGAKQVCFLNGDNAELTQRMLGVTLQNVSYVNNPFIYNQGYLPYTGTKDQYTLACVANLKTFHKGQDLLLTVLGQEKWKSRPIQLRLYGEGVNRKQLERLVTRYGLEEKVMFMGYESEKTKIWANNMGCVLPSRMEGQSLAMLEAMSFGRMVISTAVGDAERLIEHGKTGFLIEYPTHEAIDKTLEEAWNFRNDWLGMGKLSREKLFDVITEEPVSFFAKQLSEVIG
jgi:glycosyltransferase involved in cell wall biosynthesis